MLSRRVRDGQIEEEKEDLVDGSIELLLAYSNVYFFSLHQKVLSVRLFLHV